MNQIGILDWQNENSLTPYPFAQSFGFEGFIIDANFVQFDGFVPILNNVQITPDVITLSITFYDETRAILLNFDEFTGSGFSKIYRDEQNNYLGTLVFGNLAGNMFDDHVNQIINVNLPFLPSTVRSISSKSGVFSLQSQCGAVVLNSDGIMAYELTGNTIQIDALYVPSNSNAPYLKTINGVVPIDNSIFLESGNIIKISTLSSGTILFSLVGENTDTLITDSTSILPTEH